MRSSNGELSAAISNLLKLRHFRCFITVAEELSFHRAAARLRISQQQVSRTIQDLEAIVGTQLIDRTTRKVALSAAGVVLLPHAREIFDGIGGALRRTHMAASGTIGKLTISFSGFAIESSLPRVFQRFKKAYPDIDLEIREQNSGAQLESLYRREIDAGFAISPSSVPEIDKQVLIRDRFVVIAPSSMTNLRGPCGLARFKENPFILVPRRVAPGFYEQCSRLFQEAGFTPKLVQECQNTQTLLGLVSAGVGMALGPTFIASLRHKDVRYIPLRSKIDLELALISRRDDRSNTLKALKRTVMSVYTEADAP